MRLKQTGIFRGRVRVRYGYARWGWTRGGGKTWHGGIDLEGLDDTTICMPYFTDAGGTQKAIRGKVTRARRVTNRNNKTWEWGWYICVQLDADQTPDKVNYLYFCHCEKLLVSVGQTVISGQELAIMGNSGNAAEADPPYKHCHFEVRATASGSGIDPTAYAGCPNEVGCYGTNAEALVGQPVSKLQIVTIGPISAGDAAAIMALCKERGLTDQGLYKSQWAED